MLSQSQTILVADDDFEASLSTAELLRKLGYRVLIENRPQALEDELSQQAEIDLVLLKNPVPQMSILDLLKRITLRNPQIGIIIATTLETIELAIKATQAGAYAYLLRPLGADRLAGLLSSYFSTPSQARSAGSRLTPFRAQPRFCERILPQVENLAQSDGPLLIRGEQGTGKERIASLIHSLSTRRDADFINVTVANLDPRVAELELFGHARSALKDTPHTRWGFLHEAGAGTLFLNGIELLGPQVQHRLLQALETKSYSCVGERKRHALEARLLLATSQDPAPAGSPRLYERLTPFELRLPPLRERRGDIEPLARDFFHKYNSLFGRRLAGIRRQTMRLFARYRFPGNVPQLEAIIRDAVLIEASDELTPESLPEELAA